MYSLEKARARGTYDEKRLGRPCEKRTSELRWLLLGAAETVFVCLRFKHVFSSVSLDFERQHFNGPELAGCTKCKVMHNQELGAKGRVAVWF